MRLASAFAAPVLAFATLLAPAATFAQSPDARMTYPTPHPIYRTAPSAYVRRAAPAAETPAVAAKPAPKPTAAELAEKRKLDHDLRICIGC